ncbi:cellulose synthase-like protein E1 [Solanum tuberosum]|uniref:cellulose synthase-like protein E1 n=1 Tax=Solanum tuberosum TaxID=4113 RepID=UPI0003D290FF|nr:PREDICTED: cellulose synthase-like protein E1 [Solanum tuberosum]
MEKLKYEPLFETEKGKGRILYRLFATSLFCGIILIWIYRLCNIPNSGENGRYVWIGMLGAELWFGFYWFITQSVRWNRIYRHTFRDRLLMRYENELPRVDVFVCTADPVIEPPIMVINTVLSVLAYNYPPEKLSVYLSDDAGSELTFYALLEASRFAKHWLPYCKKFNVEPRSPAAYFASLSVSDQSDADFSKMKGLYEEMANKIDVVCKAGTVSDQAKLEYKGFSKWNSYSSKKNHTAILQILIDNRDEETKDIDGVRLPTLVYVAREKHPEHFHNFKDGAMNALLRVSSEISNAPVILNVDCDMYSNNSNAIQDALCFFMDEERSREIAFVQFPQSFGNATKNEVYGSLRVIDEVEFHGADGYGGPLYTGTGCFHRRDTLYGREYSTEARIDLKSACPEKMEENVHELEERLERLASSTYDLNNTQWGNEIGLKYGCPVEDVLTGLTIKCKGWKSVYYRPKRDAFVGVTATTLDQILVQHKRWSEGDLMILFSKYSPVWYGLGKLNPGLVLGYLIYCLWSPNCWATLYYSIVPSFCLLKGIPLFPQVSSKRFLPFAYVLIAELIYSFAEFLWSGGTILGWWNEQRIWLYKRTSSYMFAFLDTMLKLFGSSNTTFIVTPKVTSEDVLLRYKQEKMEFGSASPMLTILSTLAMINLFCLMGLVKKLILTRELGLEYVFETMALQILLCGILVFVNLPLYNALFFRQDKGKIPSSTAFQIGSLKVWILVTILVVAWRSGGVYGIRFVIDREECFSHKVQMGESVHFSFVVIKSEGSWHYSEEGVDLVVKGPSGEQLHDFRDKISEKTEFVAHQEGVYHFCFTNKSPYHETIDFDLHAAHFSYHDEHAKDEHFKPLFEHIGQLEEALYNIQFEQHWLEAQTDRQAIVNEIMSKRAVYKALLESSALIGVSVLQVYLLKHLFERKLGQSRV